VEASEPADTRTLARGRGGPSMETAFL